MWNSQDAVIYRDALILIINKPAGLAVHSSKNLRAKSLTDYLPDLCFGLPKLPQIAHRLDRKTSGCLILGRHKQALVKLERFFQASEVHKVYYALVHGVPEKESGTVDAAMDKSTKSNHRWKMEISNKGKESSTSYQLISTNGTISLVKLIPHTGRTHQLRLHMQHIGCPIIGDKIYGIEDKSKEMMLHAYSVDLKLYPKKENIVAIASIPQYFMEYCTKHGAAVIADNIDSIG